MRHIPIDNRSYRIQKRSLYTERIKSRWPTNQHRALSQMMIRLLCDLEEPVTQNDFKLIIPDKGTRSQTMKLLIERGYIEKICQITPFTYRLRPAGENYGRYIVTQFTRYHLDFFAFYYAWMKVYYPGTALFKQSIASLEDAYKEGLFNRNYGAYSNLRLELDRLAWRIERLKNDLAIAWINIKEENKQNLFRYSCTQLDELSALMDREFDIKNTCRSTRESYLKSGKSVLDFQIDQNSLKGSILCERIVEFYNGNYSEY